MLRKKPQKGVQTGRNLPNDLPNKYRAYTPLSQRRATQEAAPPTELESAPRHRWRRVLKWSLLVLLILVVAAAAAIAAWDARNISAAEKKMFGTGNVMALINSEKLKTDQNGRVNVLIAGYSVDDPGHQGAKLTDSIMLISLDPANHTGYMLSIPRDLYVNLGSSTCQSGYNYCKINEAYEDGGMPLLDQTVGNVLGMKIPYYALVDYSAVRDIVNALGGINVTIDSPAGRLYDPNTDFVTHGPLVDLTNGTHHLNGEQALDLSRARGDTDQLPYGSPQPVGFGLGDYQRTQDQRLIFSAIKKKINWKLILNPEKNSKILDALADHIKTNMKAQDALPYLRLFNSVPASRLQSISLNKINGVTLVQSTDYGSSTQTPTAGLGDYSQIQEAISQLNQ